MIIKNLSLSFGIQPIFSSITLTLPNDEHIGIVGDNGAGKTTFLKVILKEIEPDSGTISFNKKVKIAYLPQVITDEIPKSDITVFDYLLEGRPIAKLEQEIASFYEQTIGKTEQEMNKILKKIGDLQLELDYYEPYQAEITLLDLISGMNIDDKLLYMPISNLSGGQKSKIAFARLLYSKADVLLLDEPTNHLDFETKEYVTNYLRNYSGAIYVISHDIDFLDKITNKTLFLDKVTHTMELFPGSYSKFVKILEERELYLEKQAELQEKERIRLQKIVDKYIHGNEKKARIAKDRQKKLAKLEENKVIIQKKGKEASIKLQQDRESTSKPLVIKDLNFKYRQEDKGMLLYKINIEIPRGEKFLIVGENGVGKSTLLKLIIGKLSPKSGEIILGPKTDIGYYAQEHELLDNSKNVIENLDEFDLTENEKRGVLGKFLFTGDDLYKKINILSPGERSRLSLAKLTLQNANLLILDEPTNHLDPKTQKKIAEVLKTFEGTMIVVSHNPDFVDALGISRTLILPKGTLDYYEKGIVEHYQVLNTKNKLEKFNK
ncbi:MAG: ABC-F family ATP-binding cassette domain-containing protein [Bacilli bacterium]|nr:ABC-F family ATP-binding cassette domain-containing protein [Bacilli bacterium]